MKHTPGPWKISPFSSDKQGLIYATDEKCVAVTKAQGKGVLWIKDNAENEANAHLIAAAPELLEVCKEIVRIEVKSAKEITEMSGYVPEKLVWWDQLQQAIFKAEGRQDD